MGKEIKQPDWDNIITEPKLIKLARGWWFGTPGVAVVRNSDGQITAVQPLNVENQRRYPREADGVTWYIGPYGIRSKTEESVHRSSDSSSSNRTRRSRTMEKRLQRGGERSSLRAADVEKKNRIFNIQALHTGSGSEAPTIIPDYAIMIQACRGQDLQANRVLNMALNEGWSFLMPHDKADAFQRWVNKGTGQPSVLRDKLSDTLAAAPIVTRSGRFSPGLAVFPDLRQADNAILASIAKVPFITNDSRLLQVCKDHDLPAFSPAEFLQNIQDQG